MKNWFEQFGNRAYSGQVTITQREFEDIQLAAWKAGMGKAIHIATTSPINSQGHDIADFIEDYRNNTNTLYPREVV